ncbi:MAG: protein phosphatase 2C family protein [Alphaproteobacteria bacterium]|nr:protein phosphatase 2C family protein [Alphaproteobacteria bacterium]
MLRLLDWLSLPGDPTKSNEDSFAHGANAALVMDGATMLDDPLMPGASDAAWIAQFGARRLMAHLQEEAPRNALRAAMADAEKSFKALARAPLGQRWQLPCASVMLAAKHEKGLEFLWLGDCGAIIARGDAVTVVGETLTKRAEESRRARKLAQEKQVSSAAPGVRTQFLDHLRAARGRVNSGDYWLFSPDKRAAAHAQRKIMKVGQGSLLLLASDGFLALSVNYGVCDAAGLIGAAKTRGLAAMGEELRAIENDDARGDRFARFKKSDDATALLLEVTS